jgi:hypothetical protein
VPMNEVVRWTEPAEMGREVLDDGIDTLTLDVTGIRAEPGIWREQFTDPLEVMVVDREAVADRQVFDLLAVFESSDPALEVIV